MEKKGIDSRTSYFLEGVLAVVLLLLLSYAQWHVTPSPPLRDEVLDTLRTLGGMALASSDVPVGAVVLYGDRIIGEGFNTVERDTAAGGHAEINAISDAFRHVGYEAFQKMNRDSLVLVSTFEPCLMCRGAILEYRIRHVIFVKGKPIFHWLKEDFRTFAYYWRRRQAGPEALQDSLFARHPQFHPD